jgi:hypothetical protein
MRPLLSCLIAWALVELVPRAAAACSVCTAGRDDETNQAFLMSTIFLSLLPLAALGTLVFVLWRRIRALELGDGEPRPSVRESADEGPVAHGPAVLTPANPAR